MIIIINLVYDGVSNLKLTMLIGATVFQILSLLIFSSIVELKHKSSLAFSTSFTNYKLAKSYSNLT